ncbi:alpha-D-ribose 1-methylphosphonate 5-triphosphate diphosphatase [Halobellus salinisoli]|uniref:alpha-D-ribose 1-methylphosphonate 5-triphosphate diphosphatase n=1 Tax=Halobellus salinisoli TaxID=3108500 RepID=UPI00300ADAA6
MTRPIELKNGRVVTPTRTIEGGRVVVANGQITHVGETTPRSMAGVRSIDVDGQLVLPGLVDLHGDDIESHLYPRSDAPVDAQTALASADRTNLFNGVTTKFHAVAFEDAPDDARSLDDAAAIAREIDSASYTIADNRFHARCELVERSVEAVERLASDVSVDLLSVMHHAPEEGQFDREQFEQHYGENRGWSADTVARAATERRSFSQSERDDLVERMATLADRLGVPLASHDDESAATVDRMAACGVSISEYPLTLAAARRAANRGIGIAMGAPNLVRGGSLWDNLSAREAIDEGLVDVLCADYHPPSLLAAALTDTGEPLYERVNRVTRNPADAVGLDNRGRLETGARADVIVVDPASPPTVSRALVAGSETFVAGTTPASMPSTNAPRLLGPGS